MTKRASHRKNSKWKSLVPWILPIPTTKGGTKRPEPWPACHELQDSFPDRDVAAGKYLVFIACLSRRN